MTSIIDRRELVVASVLAVLMAVTRVGHFGEFNGPPDASWAVFFLAGLWLRDARGFPVFFALAWVSDLIAFALGTPTDCYSLAYLALIPAYGALWWAGMKLADAGVAPMRAAISVVGSAAVTFTVANLGMFWWAPPASASTLSAFATAVAGYFPGYLLTMSLYVIAGLSVEAVLRRRLARSSI